MRPREEGWAGDTYTHTLSHTLSHTHTHAGRQRNTHSCRVSTPISLYCSSCFTWASSCFSRESCGRHGRVWVTHIHIQFDHVLEVVQIGFSAVKFSLVSGSAPCQTQSTCLTSRSRQSLPPPLFKPLFKVKMRLEPSQWWWCGLLKNAISCKAIPSEKINQ